MTRAAVTVLAAALLLVLWWPAPPPGAPARPEHAEPAGEGDPVAVVARAPSGAPLRHAWQDRGRPALPPASSGPDAVAQAPGLSTAWEEAVRGVQPDAPLSGDTLVDMDPYSMRLIQRGLDAAVRPAVRACVRAGERPADAAPRPQVQVDLELAISSRDEEAVVDVVEARWPEAMPTALADCLRGAFAGAVFESDSFEFDYRLRYPLIVPI